MNYAGLYFRVWINGPDGFIKTLQIVYAGYEDICNTSLFKIVNYPKPKISTLTMRYIHSQNILFAFWIYAQDIIYTTRLCPAFFLYFIIHRIQPYNAIQLIKRTLLP